MAVGTDWYQVGAGPGNGLVEGQQIALDRARMAQEAQTRDLQNQRLAGQVQDEGTLRTQKAQKMADLAIAYPRSGVAVPSAVTAPAAPPAPTDAGASPAPEADPSQASGIPMPGAAPSAPGAPAGPAPSVGAPPATGLPPGIRPDMAAAGNGATVPTSITPTGDRERLLAGIAGRSGDDETASKHTAAAREGDVRDIYGYGAKMAQDPDKVNAALKMVSQKDPSITIYKVAPTPGDKDARYRMTVVSPDGTVHPTDLNGAQMAQILGAQALMEHGFAAEALPKFAEVSTALAAEVKTRNATNEASGKFNNQEAHEASDDLSKRMGASAEMMKASAMVEKNNIDRKSGKFGTPMTLIGSDNKPMVVQPVMSPSGAVSYTQVELPPGARMPKQVDPASIERLAATMVGTSTGTNDAGGKPVMFTPQTAYAAAQDQIMQDRPAGGNATGGFKVPSGVTPEAAAAAGGKKTGGIPAPAAPPATPADRAASARARLAQDDALKAGGAEGILGRAMRGGGMPLTMGERSQLQDQIRQGGQ